MLVTLLGIVIEVRLEHPSKVPASIVSIIFGSVIDVSPVQFLKTYIPNFVTELGMVIDVRPLLPQKAPPPMLVTELGMIVFLHPVISSFVAVLIIALQSFLLS